MLSLQPVAPQGLGQMAPGVRGQPPGQHGTDWALAEQGFSMPPSPASRSLSPSTTQSPGCLTIHPGDHSNDHSDLLAPADTEQ